MLNKTMITITAAVILSSASAVFACENPGNRTSADRAIRAGVKVDFEPTCSELLSCLEISNDAAKLPAELY
jgi:hypothetical protein